VTDQLAGAAWLTVTRARVWLAVQGPSYSWGQRELQDSRLGLALGWWHERHPREVLTNAAPITWQPPARDEVRAYYLSYTTTLAYLTATVASTAKNRTVGAGVEVLLDRDRWNRRAGLAPGLAAELAAGTVEGADTGVVGIAALARWYLLPDRVAVVLAPAVLRVRVADLHSPGAVDVSGRVGVALAVGRVEVRVDSPPLSYVSTQRWHGRPFSTSLAVMMR
jgi:hypothetical protein